jgi:hypothetical protein
MPIFGGVGFGVGPGSLNFGAVGAGVAFGGKT